MLKQAIKRWLIKVSGSPLSDKISGFCQQIILLTENGANHNISTNGELRSFQSSIVGKSNPLIVFDVGANRGDWTKTILEIAPDNTEVHLFEIVPATFEKLSQKISGKNTRLNNIGLSDESGDIDLHYYPQEDSGSSVVRLPWSTDDHVIKCEVTTGDEYCAVNNIDQIDYLKIDAEGMDFRILKGFEGMLSHRKIHTIQFEFNKASILTKKLLIDYFELLQPYGFIVGRIYPQTTKFKEYDLFQDEKLIQGNYLARLKPIINK